MFQLASFGHPLAQLVLDIPPARICNNRLRLHRVGIGLGTLIVLVAKQMRGLRESIVYFICYISRQITEFSAHT